MRKMLYIFQLLIIAISFLSCSKDETTGGGDNPDEPDKPVAAGHYRNPLTADNKKI